MIQTLLENSPNLGSPSHPADIAIIGGGASGTLLLHQLAQRCGTHPAPNPSPTILLIDPATTPGPGIAHSTTHSGHVLNVPAGRMSALPDDPDHFVRWANSNTGPLGHSITGADFVPRGIYGSYLKHLVAQAAATLGPRLRIVPSRAIDLHLYPGEPENSQAPRRIILDSGESLHTQHVVLALGNFTPADPTAFSPDITAHPNYFRDPWKSSDALTAALHTPAAQQGILIIGTGLSMMDIVMQIRAASPTLPITAISRRGLISQPHRSHHHAPTTQPPPPIDYWPNTANGLLRAIRTYIHTCQKREIDWREAITALRPVTSRLWQSMPAAERQRFLAKLVPYWDTHRHRCAPSIAEAINHARASGQLTIIAARLGHTSRSVSGFDVTLHQRDGSTRAITPGLIINCTGPHMDLAKVGDPLIHSLLAQRAIHQDELRIGMEIDKMGRPLDVHGLPHPSLWTIGPLRRAALWETIAIPEIRVQAADLATHLADALNLKT